MTSSLEVQVCEDIFKCSICLETFKSPKSLPCLHTFCELCITEYITSTERKKGSKLSNYSCPICRAVISPIDPTIDTSKWASLLPGNFNISFMMETVKWSDCQPCQRQDTTTKGVYWCKDCAETLCDACFSTHKFLKTTMNHHWVKLGEAGSEPTEIDLNCLSDKCPVHTSKVVETFCFDHNQLCCVLCLTVNHRKCDDVRLIEDIAEDQKEKLMGIKTVIREVQSTTECIITRRQQHRKNLGESAKDLEKHLYKIIDNIKNKLDSLLKTCLKEVDNVRSETDNKFQDELHALQKLCQNMCHLSKVNSLVINRGTRAQQFIHYMNSTAQLESNVLTVLQNFQEDFDLTMTCNLSEIWKELDAVETIGTIMLNKFPTVDEKSTNIAIQVIKALIYIDATNLQVSLSNCRVITINDADLTCGLSINDKIIICGDYSNCSILEIEIEAGVVRHRQKYHFVKNIAFDALKNIIYVSFADGYFLEYEYIGRKFRVLRRTYQGQLGMLGAIGLHESNVYVISDNWIKRIEDKKNITSISCFPSNTDCRNKIRNGLAIDSKTLNFVYTSKESEIISTTRQGEQNFCFKSKQIEQPTCVLVHSSGMIFVGDEVGSVHVITRDGKSHKTVLEKSKKIKRLCGMWMDRNEQTLFICGNEFIEMYSLSVK